MKIIRLIASVAFAAALSACVTTEYSVTQRGDFPEFRRSLSNTSYGYQVVTDPTGSAPVPVVERFEVQPGDCWHNEVSDDCSTDRERSELTQRGARYSDQTEMWYGWYVYFPLDFIDISPTRTTFAQFHQAGAEPILMFLTNSDGYYGEVRDREKPIQEISVIDENEEWRGKWLRIEVHAKWSHDKDGFIEIYRDGEKRGEYRGVTFEGDGIYFKYGIYRSGISRYMDAFNKPEAPAQIVYFTGVKAGETREEIQLPVIEK